MSSLIAFQRRVPIDLAVRVGGARRCTLGKRASTIPSTTAIAALTRTTTTRAATRASASTAARYGTAFARSAA
jgi:hypothetical protein